MHQTYAGSEDVTDENMTSEERADRRYRISEAVIGSDNRVQDFINLIAKMCAERTRAKKVRVDLAPDRGNVLGHGLEPFEVHQRDGDEGQVSIW